MNQKYFVLQWDRMLSLIGDTLEENGIGNVFVKGNVFVRNRAITNFKVISAVALKLVCTVPLLISR